MVSCFFTGEISPTEQTVIRIVALITGELSIRKSVIEITISIQRAINWLPERLFHYI